MFKRHLIFWVIATVLFMVTTTIWGKSVVVEQVVKEQSMVLSSMGESASGKVRDRTNETYLFCCNWLADLTRTMFLPPEKDKQGLWDKINKTHEAFWVSVYQVIYRVFVIGEWLLVFWVVFIASFFQGLVRREISVANTAWSSPIRYHLGLHYSLFCFGALINLLVCPWALHPYVSVGLLTAFSVVAYFIAANIQQKV